MNKTIGTIFPLQPKLNFVSPVSEAQVTSLLLALNGSISAGQGELKAAPIKAISHLISTPPTHIGNTFLCRRIFIIVKIARVFVLHKGGSLHDTMNYEPISVLPLSKIIIIKNNILERIIYSQLICYLGKKKLIAH